MLVTEQRSKSVKTRYKRQIKEDLLASWIILLAGNTQPDKAQFFLTRPSGICDASQSVARAGCEQSPPVRFFCSVHDDVSCDVASE
jgi:hypothetical protein